MSDESSYYSPGELPSDDKENENAQNNDPLFRNLITDFQDEVKPNGSKSCDNREPMKVFLRIRPFSNNELKASENQGCLKIVDEKTVLLQAPQDSFTFKSSIRGIAEQTHQFSFTKVYGDNTTQKDIFDDSILGFVKDFLDGINCLIFTYGVTNSGKTFTIQGNPKNGGILPRTLDVLFNSIKGKQYERMDLKPSMYQDVIKLSKEQQNYEELLKKAVTNAGQRENIDLSLLWKMDTTSQSDLSTISAASAASSSYVTANDADYSSISDELKERVCDGTVLDTKSQGPIMFCIWVSFAEIYNEYVYDLLDPTPSGKGKKRPVLKLGDDKKGNPYIKGLKEIQVSSADEAFKVVRVGQKNQNIAATKLNQNSSRSHSIFTIKILRVADVDEPHVVRISRLSFVDLAGSERYCKTQSTGNRLKEASNINTSIMTLGKCIEYLRYNQQHKNHPLIVPFRETKLTRLFQGFFLGKGKAAMIVNTSQCASVFDETYNVLKFSAVAKQIKTKSVRNTELFKPKQLPKPSLPGTTPMHSNKSSWAGMGLTTPRPIQKAILCESMCDGDDEQFQALVASYEELRKQLIEERRKNALMEVKIREEVCSEMSEQLVEMERNYSERFQEDHQTLEEQCERRIEMLTRSMKKTRKRKKIDRMEDEDDSYVSSVLLHAEKIKVKERDEEIRALRAKLAEKEMAHEFYKQTHTPDQHPRIIKTLQGDLDEANETLELHKSHIDDLQTKLNAAQDCLEERDIEVEKLKEIVDAFEESADNEEIMQLKNLLQETSGALDEARKKLDQRDERLKEKDDVIAKLREQVAARKDEKASKAELEAFERELTKLEEQGKLLHERNEFQGSEIKQLRLEKDDIEVQGKAANDKIGELKRQLEESEDRREQLLFKDEERNMKIKRFENIIKNHETALAESESIIEQLNEKISQLKAEVDVLRVENGNRRVDQIGNGPKRVQEVEEVIRKLKEETERLENSKSALEKDNRVWKARTLELENELLSKDEANEIEKTKYETDVEDMRRKMENIRHDLVSREEKSEEEEKQWLNEIEKLTQNYKEREDELKRKVNDYEREIEQLKMNIESNDKKTVEKDGNIDKEVKGLKREHKLGVGGSGKMSMGLNSGSSIRKSRLGSLKGVKSKPSLRPSSTTGPSSPFKSNFTALKDMEKILKDTTHALDKKNEQVMLRNKKIAELEGNLKKLEVEAEILNGDKKSLERKLEESELRAECEINDLRSAMKKAEEKLLKGNEEVLMKEGKMQELRQQIEILTEEKSVLEERAESLSKKFEEHNTCHEATKLELELLKKKFADSDFMQEMHQKEIATLSEKVKTFEMIEIEFAATKEENESLKSKVESSAKLEKDLIQVKIANENLQSDLQAADRHKEEILHLKSEIKGLKVENSSLIDDIASKNSDQRSLFARLNQTLEENVQLTSRLHEANEKISSLELQIQLNKTEKELDSMHTKQQVMNALLEASKKDEVRVKEFSKEIDDRNGIIEGLKNELEERKLEIEDLTKQIEDGMESKRELVKKQQTIHDLRCTIMKKDEELKEQKQLQETIANLEEKLKEFEEVKFQKETMMMQIETLKRTVKERDQQIATARGEIEKLEKELKEQIERDRAFQTPKFGEMILSDKKRSGSATHPTSLRRSTRLRKASAKNTFEENEHIFEGGSSSSKKAGRRNVLFDLNENAAPDVFEADTPGSAKNDKPKRRKLLAKNIGLCAESPQVIPPSPTKHKDDVTEIVRRQLRSTNKR